MIDQSTSDYDGKTIKANPIVAPTLNVLLVAEPSNKLVYIVVAVLVLVAVSAFLYFH